MLKATIRRNARITDSAARGDDQPRTAWTTKAISRDDAQRSSADGAESGCGGVSFGGREEVGLVVGW